MHELAVATELVTQVERAAGSEQVIAVHVRLGRLSGLVPDSLEFCFQIAAKGTVLEGARLVVESIEPVIWCPSCQAAVTLESTTRLHCPVCGTASALVLAGRDLELRSLEVADNAEDDRTRPSGLLGSSRP